ncbi:MAG: hypothetical protein ABJB40_07335, partial [Acidobacteriota bacterium]
PFIRRKSMGFFFHGEQVAIFPAAIFLFLAAGLFIVVRRISSSRHEGVRSFLILFAVVLLLVGLYLAAIGSSAYI